MAGARDLKRGCLNHRARRQEMTSLKIGVSLVHTRCDKVQNNHAGALKKEAKIPTRVTTTKQRPVGRHRFVEAKRAFFRKMCVLLVLIARNR